MGTSKVDAATYEKIKKQVVAELFADGGVGYDRAALELLYYIPDDFKNIYVRVFHEAFRDTDGGTGGRGVSNGEKGTLGRAIPGIGGVDAQGKKVKDRTAAAGGLPGSGGHVHNTQKSSRGSKQASAKSTFGYNGAMGEAIAGVKDKADKRLRAIARDMQFQLEELKAARVSTEVKDIENRVEKGELSRGQGSKLVSEALAKRRELDEDRRVSGMKIRAICSGCGKFLGDDWKFCAGCGSAVEK